MPSLYSNEQITSNIIVVCKYYKRLNLPNKFFNLNVINPDKSNFDKMVGGPKKLDELGPKGTYRNKIGDLMFTNVSMLGKED